MTKSELQEKFDIDDLCIDSKTVVSENKATFELDIKDLQKKGELFYRIQIDDCHITNSETLKCDWVFHRCETDDFYFVELKGRDIDKAYKQIVTTLTKHIPTVLDNCIGFIVSSQSPSNSPAINKMKQEFRKKYGRALYVKNIKCVFKPSDETIR